jgi:uncharacterized membrane protein YdjX (TVP38/TMEM64 family)
MSPENPTSNHLSTEDRKGGADWRFIAIIIVVTLLPFLLFAGQIDAFVTDWVKRPISPWAAWLAVVALLWADILLPIPSSVVTTFAGAKLGWLNAFIASDVGMTLAAITAFGLGRGAERIRLARLSEKQQQIGAAGVNHWGPWAIVISRGVPLVAEVVLIYVASKRISFWAFFWPALLTNTIISLGYALLGQWAADREWLAIALGASGVVPLLLGLAIRQWLLKR